MKLKALFATIFYALIGVLMLFQLNVMNVLAIDADNPITAAISSVIGNSPEAPSPSPSPIATSTPTPTPVPVPVSAPIITPSASPSPSSSPIPFSTNGGYKISPYLVYPADKPLYPAYETALNSYLIELQKWYMEKIGKTFEINPLQVVKSEYSYDTMRCDPDPFDSVPPSSQCLNDPKKLEGDWMLYMYLAIYGLEEGLKDQNVDLIFSAGGGGFAAGDKLENNDVGFAITGDWVLEPISGVANSWGIPCNLSDGWQCTGGVPKGTPAHELGHAFGLGHPDNGPSIMKWHGDYPTVGFLPQEVEALKKSPFFKVSPTASPTPVPTPTPSPSPSSSPSPSPVPVIAPIINSNSPVSPTQGTIVTLTGSGFTNSSKVYVGGALMPDNYNEVLNNGTTIKFLLTTAVLFASNNSYPVQVKNGDVTSNQITITIAPSIIQNVPPVGAKQVLIAPAVTLDNTSSEIVMASSNFNSTVTIPASVNNPTLNFSNLLSTSANSSSASFNNILTVNATTSIGTINIQIPAATTLYGPVGWNGIINAPRLMSNSQVTPSSDPGFNSTTESVLEIGLGDVLVTFDKAVRILIPNQAGKLVGFQRGGSFYKITQSCSSDSQSAGDNLPAGADCYISSGSDLVIWTKHFTKFVTYTQSKPLSQASGNVPAPVCGDQKPQNAPKLLSAVATGKNQVTLTWSSALGPVTYYLVSYGGKPGSSDYGNPNIGGRETTSYVVKNLSESQTYYFKVRAGNNCAPGEFSNEIAVKATGDKLIGPAKGFKSGSLGLSETKFKPINITNPNHITQSGATWFEKILSFFSRLLKIRSA
ncbi:hypothetical protein A3B42_04185 [Candidatus Daviesbacteria bacterium RIFCSPLOWO2_01_FULL_38_10]|nr:MAG: hypothetical protein A3B42_04185 [Candidatus Daviesbacteria bacterium RIFCSPLOWO2_01_FULL_38_10]